MFPQAADETQPNNLLFSTCSRAYISTNIASNSGMKYFSFFVLLLIGEACFLKASNICGNGILEPNEEWCVNILLTFGVFI